MRLEQLVVKPIVITKEVLVLSIYLKFVLVAYWLHSKSLGDLNSLQGVVFFKGLLEL